MAISNTLTLQPGLWSLAKITELFNAYVHGTMSLNPTTGKVTLVITGIDIKMTSQITNMLGFHTDFIESFLEPSSFYSGEFLSV